MTRSVPFNFVSLRRSLAGDIPSSPGIPQLSDLDPDKRGWFFVRLQLSVVCGEVTRDRRVCSE